MTTAASGGRTLVAGIGNIFCSDDAFGVEVANALQGVAVPDDVDVADYGIRGVHLAYELLDDRYERLIMVDAVPLDETPGALAVLDISGYEQRPEFEEWAGDAVDAHSMQPEAVLVALHKLGGTVPHVFVVGCQPGRLDDGVGLSDAVAAAVPEAVRLVTELVADRVRH